MWTEEELEEMNREELKHIIFQKGLTSFMPKNSSKLLLIDLILESQDTVQGS